MIVYRIPLFSEKVNTIFIIICENYFIYKLDHQEIQAVDDL